MSLQHDPTQLRGRSSERATLDALIHAARGGKSHTMVLRGEAGIGKSALLEYVAVRSTGCLVVRAVGCESEMELPFAAVHLLSQPLLEGIHRLPSPQREALETALGLSPGRPPDRFFVGLALLSQLSQYAEAQPVICLVDDAQWLDRSSAQVLSFIARRLYAESVVIVLAERDGDAPSEFEGLPEMRLTGLSDVDAAQLVASATLGPLDTSVRGRIVAEAHGNPLALLELPRGQSSIALAGGFSVAGRATLPNRIEASYRDQLRSLPSSTQQLLLVAAADPVGDPELFWRAATELGIPVDAAAPAEADDLLEIDARVGFRHPLLRSAVYQAASPTERRQAHRALAAATDAEVDPDRRAWHRAQAVLGPDEDVATELERSAERAQARGGLAAAAAFMQRSVTLTRDPARRAVRALVAAQASLQAGAFEAALSLVAAAEAGPLDDLSRARADRLLAQVAFAQDRGGEAPVLLMRAAKKLETLDARLSRDTYLDAFAAALFAGRLARDGGTLLDVSRAAAAAPDPSPQLPHDLLLEAFALVFTAGRPAAVPALHRAVTAFARGDVAAEAVLRWGWLASRAAILVWDYERGLDIADAAVKLARDAGALEALAVVDNACGQVATIGGDFTRAAMLMAEVDTLKKATATRIAPHAALSLSGLRGRETEATKLVASVTASATLHGQGTAVQYAQWTTSVLMNGLGRYEEAREAAVQASTHHTPELYIASWALTELIEAATRTDRVDVARVALHQLTEHLEGCDSEWALGIRSRSCALLEERDTARHLYREAIDHLSRTPLRPDLARAHLLYGEWLRREGQRIDAREQLRTAHQMLSLIGMEAFAERARRELAATGEKARSRTGEIPHPLTPQEAQIAQLATDGLTNPEIGARLFLSARTVEWHLSKVFAKLRVSSRRELRAVLPNAGLAAMPAS